MRKKLVFVLVALLLVLSGLLGACAKEAPTPAPTPTTPVPAPKPTTPTPKPEKVYELKFFNSMQEIEAPWTIEFVNKVNADSGGRIKLINFFPGEHPYTFADMFTVIRDGKGDIGFTMSPYCMKAEPILGLVELPFLLDGYRGYSALLKDPTMADIVKPTYLDILEKWNQVPLVTFCWPGCMLSVDDRFVDDFDSLKGKKIRVNSPQLATMVEVMGGTPEYLGWGEVYPALQRGIIDGFTTSFYAAYGAKLYEIVKYSTILDHYPAVSWFSINKDVLNSLPSDLQDILVRSGSEHADSQQSSMFRLEGEAMLDAMRVNGVKFQYLHPDFRKEIQKRLEPYWREWAEEAGPEGPAILDRLIDFYSKWAPEHLDTDLPGFGAKE